MKSDWGTKRTCQSCGAPFYDMRRTPIICPKCKTAFDPEAFTKVKRGRPQPVAEEKRPAVVKPVPEDEVGLEIVLPDDGEEIEEIEEEGTGNDEEDVIEDASELVQDDADVGKVIDKTGEDT